jgi:hypothetical protein
MNTQYKKSTIALLVIVLLTKFSFGQLAIISDKDGYSNVRTSAESGGKISDTLHNGPFVFCSDETKGNWSNIFYSKNDQELSGYVYHDRIKFISDYERIPALPIQINPSTYGKDSIKIILTVEKFDKSRCRVSYSKDSHSQIQFIQFINGKQYWGTDGEQPKTEYKSILIIIGNRKITLPWAAIENLFEPSIYNTQVNYDRKNDILYIQSYNSDGAGGYEVIWRIGGGTYKDRYIFNGF